MGSGGRAIGPDGKLIQRQQPQQQKTNISAPRGGRVQQQQPPQRGMVRPMRPPHFTPGMPRPTPGMPPRPLMGGPMALVPPFMAPPSMMVPSAPSMMAPPAPMMAPPAPMMAPPPFANAGGSYGFFGNAAMAEAKPPVAPLIGTGPAPLLPKLPVAPVASTAVAVAPPVAEAPSHVGEVPGFGTNSSIHELFGKMVWRKMEGIKDATVVDRLQNRIMNLIHDALADQAAPPVASGAPDPTATGFRTF